MKQLLSVDEAQKLVLARAELLGSELCSLHDCAWRVLAKDVVSLRTQPPFPAAAMDGYAVRDVDAREGNSLKVIGESAAGRGFDGSIQAGETVRIFTGAPVPEGAGTVVMQEDVTVLAEGVIEISAPVTQGRHVRKRGLDFEAGGLLVAKGTLLDSATLSLAAAGGHAVLPVVRRPVVAILATGDELVSPGEPTGRDQIVASNSFGVAALAQRAGAHVIDLGIVPDNSALIRAAVEKAFADGADVLITLGGASVGDHDLIKPVLTDMGINLDFWQIAMRPGKPLMHARHGQAHMLGLPGNPVSSLVCSYLFLVPLLAHLSGKAHQDIVIEAQLELPMRENDKRQDYVRALVTHHANGTKTVRAFDIQDSSMLSVLAAANGLIVREPHAPAAHIGDTVRTLMLR